MYTIILYWKNIIIFILVVLLLQYKAAAQELSDFAPHGPAPESINGYELIWNDEFNYNGAPDPNKWTYEYGFIRNRELQWYQPNNAICKNGLLIIEGRKEKVVNPNYNPYSWDWRASNNYAEYTSSSLITKGINEWEPYGYYEIRARIDTSMGSWPAIWMLGTKNIWPSCGEIDIMEFYRINGNSFILANLAWGSGQKQTAKWSSTKIKLSEYTKTIPDWADRFHVWGMKWEEGYINVFIDGNLVHSTSLDTTINADGLNPFRENNTFYLLLNLAIGSNGGKPSDAKMPIKFEVDYVRVYKPVESKKIP